MEAKAETSKSKAVPMIGAVAVIGTEWRKLDGRALGESKADIVGHSGTPEPNDYASNGAIPVSSNHDLRRDKEDAKIKQAAVGLKQSTAGAVEVVATAKEPNWMTTEMELGAVPMVPAAKEPNWTTRAVPTIATAKVTVPGSRGLRNSKQDLEIKRAASGNQKSKMDTRIQVGAVPMNLSVVPTTPGLHRSKQDAEIKRVAVGLRQSNQTGTEIQVGAVSMGPSSHSAVSAIPGLGPRMQGAEIKRAAAAGMKQNRMTVGTERRTVPTFASSNEPNGMTAAVEPGAVRMCSSPGLRRSKQDAEIKCAKAAARTLDSSAHSLVSSSPGLRRSKQDAEIKCAAAAARPLDSSVHSVVSSSPGLQRSMPDVEIKHAKTAARTLDSSAHSVASSTPGLRRSKQDAELKRAAAAGRTLDSSVHSVLSSSPGLRRSKQDAEIKRAAAAGRTLNSSAHHSVSSPGLMCSSQDEKVKHAAAGLQTNSMEVKQSPARAGWPYGRKAAAGSHEVHCSHNNPVSKDGAESKPDSLALWRTDPKHNDDISGRKTFADASPKANADMMIQPELVLGSNIGLVEAREVKEEDDGIILGSAEIYDGPMEEEREQIRDQKRIYYIGSIFCLVLAQVLIVPILWWSGVFDPAIRDTIVVSAETPSNAPSGSPTLAPTPFFLPLPEYTVDILQNGPLASPQERAYRWIQDDPNFEEYSDAQKQQRFALATFYHATNGDLGSWTQQDDWMSYDVHECEWFSKWISLGPDFPNICDEEGNYQSLILTKNGLSGSLPLELALLTNLEVFDVATNEIRGTIPSQIGLMTSLRELILDVNQLSGQVPSEIGQLTHLEYFFVHTNPVTGTIMTEVGLLTNMIDFEWADTFSQGTIPTQLGLMTGATALVLWQNLLDGPIPTEVGLMTTLSEVFGVYGQNLAGTIPTEIGRLTGLDQLYLDVNSLTGTIPSEIGHLGKAEGIYFNLNDLEGTIPSELGGLSSLEVLALFSTNISGTIPSEFGGLTSMWWLPLHETNLSGTVPVELGALADNQTGSLEHVSLNETLVTGEIPADLCLILEMSFDCSDELCGCDCVCQFVAQGSVESLSRPRVSENYDLFLDYP
ncbi:Leucine Rich Repeat [Seminavis robusta]|uniref:Leucine Rich Repeat n=1 Tax=Seminavis robusta TaxID=568900 RepID=A0A9N8H973_9STRA|nr:Leucine Rich Repeat [Seminavis robusta]|eukprot:Sro181_g079170.1 Leucine Rich Repeat (1097) ;mRNA; f:77014-80304